jgi:hypothetical protein
MGTVDHAEPASVTDTNDRSSEPQGHQRATPGGDLAEAEVDDARAADHAEPASVKDTTDRSSEPLESPALMEQAAWDASVMPISTGMDADATPIAAVAVTGDISVRPASTGVGTDTRAGTRAMDSDRGVASGTEGTSSQFLSEEDSSDIVGRGPRTGATSASVKDTSDSVSALLEDPTSGEMRSRSIGVVAVGPRTEATAASVKDTSDSGSAPLEDPTSGEMRSRSIGVVVAESGDQGVTQQGRVRTPVVWGQGIPLRPAMTIQRPAETIPSQAALADLNTSSAILSLSDAIDRASCLATTREPSVRAEADEAGISRRAEAAETVILGALTADTLTLFRDYECKMNHLIQLDSLLSYNDILAATNKYKLT